jgi:superfamily II DNA/RNA helicase
VIVPTRLLVHRTENYINEIGRSCDGLVVETVTSSSKPTAKLEANVIVATPGRLFDYIRRRLVDTSQVRFFLVDDVDYVVDFSALRQLCVRVARKSPKTTQFLFLSDLSTRASDFVNDMLRSNTWEKHEVKAVELNANKIVHLLFRCSGEQEKLDIICKLPGVVQISMLIIFVQVSDPSLFFTGYK